MLQGAAGYPCRALRSPLPRPLAFPEGRRLFIQADVRCNLTTTRRFPAEAPEIALPFIPADDPPFPKRLHRQVHSKLAEFRLCWIRTRSSAWGTRASRV